MNHKLLALVGVGVASVVAASGGAFMALREAAPAGQSVSTQDTLSDRPVAGAAGGDVAGAGVPSGRVVTETEGVIPPEPGTSATPAHRAPPNELSAAANNEPPSRVMKPAPGTPRAPVSTQAAERRANGPASSGTSANRQGSASRVTREPDQRSATTSSGDRDRAAATAAAREPAPLPAPTPAEPAQPQAPIVEQPLARPELTELAVPADSVIGLQIDRTISSEHARLEDAVEARVTRDVRAGGRVAFPSGSRMLGSVVMVEKGGKVRERARLGIRFHTLVLADGTRVPVQTDTIYREGSSPAGESAAKMGGGAVGGAIIGAILGGGRGAAIGGSIGAAAGTAAVLASDRNPATLPAGSTVTVRLQSPATVTVEP